MTAPLSIGQYLLDQLYRHGVRHIFGVPGDYILSFYDLIEKSPLQNIGTTREDAAGFAADAYARVKGKKPKRVVILGCSHRYPIDSASVVTRGVFDTPLGPLPIDFYLKKKPKTLRERLLIA